MPTFAESRRDVGYFSNFYFDLAPVKIGAFFIAFGAVLLLSNMKRTANLLSISSLGGSIMFNPKKPRIYNDIVTKRYCGRGFAVVRSYRTTQTIPYNYIFFCC